MKGQTQAVTAVLISGILVAGIASVYVWGVPIVEKRQGQAQTEAVENSAIGIRDAIRSSANDGEGSTSTESLSLENGEVEVVEDENYIEITTYGTSSYPVGSWQLISGSGRQGLSIGQGLYGIRGQDTSGVVAARRLSESSSGIRYRVEFRNMRTDTPSGPQLRLIDLESSGSTKSGGDVELSFSNDGVREDFGDDAYSDGESSFDRIRTIIKVDLR